VNNEPGSFRDPATTVFYVGDRVLRGLSEQAAADWAQLSATSFFPKLIDEGKAVATHEVEPGELPSVDVGAWALLLEHERIPFVSYPYEWTFEMLRDAAVLHLEILLAALDDGVTMKDGYAFNVQWRGAAPVFIDIGSFERLGAGGPWVGYRQFCQTFLYPLLLQAHLDIPFQRFLRGHLDGFEPHDMRQLFPGLRRFRKGVFRHVYLHSVMEARSTKGTEAVKKELRDAGFGAELTKATVTKLLKLVRSLRSKRSTSGWANYRGTCSYTDDDRDAKQRFVRQAIEARPRHLVWDLGANDGAYSRLAAEHADHVVAVDSDDVVVDALYRSLRQDGPDNVLPLVMNLVDPSPGRGWRGVERRAFTDRGRPDMVLGLALVHHLALASNVPLAEVVAWLHSFGSPLVVEFVEPHDPMAARLLANKPAGLFDDYRIDVFQQLLDKSFTIERRETLPSGSRTLYSALPRA
jgi:hypothetical protein